MGRLPPPLVTVVRIAFLFALSTRPLLAEEFDWNKVHLGLTTEWVVPQGDFGTYWTNGLGVGVIIQYELTERFSLYGSGSLSRFGPASHVSQVDIPDIALVNLSGGIRVSTHLHSFFRGITQVGLGDQIFFFHGEAASLVIEEIESEVGVHGSIGFGIQSNNVTLFEVYARIHTVFASPERINIWTFGLNVFLR